MCDVPTHQRCTETSVISGSVPVLVEWSEERNRQRFPTHKWHNTSCVCSARFNPPARLRQITISCNQLLCVAFPSVPPSSPPPLPACAATSTEVIGDGGSEIDWSAVDNNGDSPLGTILEVLLLLYCFVGLALICDDCEPPVPPPVETCLHLYISSRLQPANCHRQSMFTGLA